MREGLPHLAERLRLLFETMPREPGGREMHTTRTVVEALRQNGIQVSPGNIDHLRSGRRSNPSAQLVAGLARVFGVPVGYFVDDVEAERVARELRSLAALRDAGVQKVMLRAHGLSSEGLEHLAAIAERFRRDEGLGAAPAQGSDDEAG